MRAIARSVERILCASLQRSFWIDRLGLVHCAFVIPTELLVTPVKCLFSANPWLLNLEPDEYLRGPHYELPNSFFAPRVLSQGMVAVIFLRKRPLKTYPPTSDEPIPNTITVDDGLLSYLDEWEATPPDDWENGLPDKDGKSRAKHADPRLLAFLLRNRRAVENLFGLQRAVFLIPNFYLAALSELRDATRMRTNRGRYCYLVSGEDRYGAHAVLCFMFRRELSVSYRLHLRSFSDLLLAFFRRLDRNEMDRRKALIISHDPILHGALHDLRNALGILGNKLNVIRVNAQKNNPQKALSKIQDALASHDVALNCVARTEAALVPQNDSCLPVLVLDRLVDSWRSLWGLPDNSDLDVVMFPGDIETPFQLTGPPSELGHALYQFIEGELSSLAPSGHPVTDPDDSESDKVRVYILLLPERHCLHISMHGRQQIPEYVDLSLRSVNVFDKLPSRKIHGGHGVLTAISLIRHRFFGTCEYGTDSDGKMLWEISVPITVVTQYPLFGLTSLPNGDER